MSDLAVMQGFSLANGVTYKIRELHDGFQVLFRFPNGAGASVVRHMFSYGGENGLWEAAPIMFNTVDWDSWEFIGRAFDLPGFDSDDVRGWLIESDVDEILAMVASL